MAAFFFYICFWLMIDILLFFLRTFEHNLLPNVDPVITVLWLSVAYKINLTILSGTSLTSDFIWLESESIYLSKKRSAAQCLGRACRINIPRDS